MLAIDNRKIQSERFNKILRKYLIPPENILIIT